MTSGQAWNEHITLTKRTYTMSDLLNEEAARRHPHKQAWMNKYPGILIFKLRPPGRSCAPSDQFKREFEDRGR
jgi:hypothetical protein